MNAIYDTLKFVFLLFIVNMINQSYLQYIPEEKRQQWYNSMVQDVYYFYDGYNPNQIIKSTNGNMYDLNKNKLIDM